MSHKASKTSNQHVSRPNLDLDVTQKLDGSIVVQPSAAQRHLEMSAIKNLRETDNITSIVNSSTMQKGAFTIISPRERILMKPSAEQSPTSFGQHVSQSKKAFTFEQEYNKHCVDRPKNGREPEDEQVKVIQLKNKGINPKGMTQTGFVSHETPMSMLSAVQS